MIDVRQLHIDNGYFVKLTNNKERNICVAKIPANIFVDLPETTTIYEMEDERVSVYRNKRKFLSKRCPNYAIRVMVWSHLLRMLEDRNMYSIPVVAEDNGTILKDCTNLDTILPITSLLEEPEIHNNVELEIKLLDAIAKCSKSGVEPPKEVLEGFVASVNMFKGD